MQRTTRHQCQVWHKTPSHPYNSTPVRTTFIRAQDIRIRWAEINALLLTLSYRTAMFIFPFEHVVLQCTRTRLGHARYNSMLYHLLRCLFRQLHVGAYKCCACARHLVYIGQIAIVFHCICLNDLAIFSCIFLFTDLISGTRMEWLHSPTAGLRSEFLCWLMRLPANRPLQYYQTLVHPELGSKTQPRSCPSTLLYPTRTNSSDSTLRTVTRPLCHTRMARYEGRDLWVQIIPN